MRTLDDIACLYGTDKSSLGHGYCHTYDALLSPMRSLPVNVLEIGVWEGAGIAMWREYFEKGLIVGVDVDTGRAREGYIEGTHIRQGDASDKAFIADVITEFGWFDVVIDDGSHLAPIAQRTHALIWPHVAPGGYYIVEDLHTYWWTRANAPGSEEWLLDLARDCIGRGDSRQDGMTHPTDIESVMFYPCMVAIRKRNSH